jgi:SNF family Na+-dependent transporter
MLDGSEDGRSLALFVTIICIGLRFFLQPNLTILAHSRPWIDAAQQIFFSLSLGGGGLTTLASYNDFNNNLLRLICQIN